MSYVLRFTDASSHNSWACEWYGGWASTNSVEEATCFATVAEAKGWAAKYELSHCTEVWEFSLHNMEGET